MGQDDAFEVPRNVTLDRVKVFVGTALCVVTEPIGAALRGNLLFFVLPFAIAGLLILCAMLPIHNQTRDARRRGANLPLLLRISDDGVWLGGGWTVSWRDVGIIREIRLPCDGSGSGAWPRKLQITFRRRWPLLATRWPLWFWVLPLARVTVPLETAERGESVVARLEAMRKRADDLDGGNPSRRSKPPVARVVRR